MKNKKIAGVILFSFINSFVFVPLVQATATAPVSPTAPIYTAQITSPTSNETWQESVVAPEDHTVTWNTNFPATTSASTFPYLVSTSDATKKYLLFDHAGHPCGRTCNFGSYSGFSSDARSGAVSAAGMPQYDQAYLSAATYNKLFNLNLNAPANGASGWQRIFFLTPGTYKLGLLIVDNQFVTSGCLAGQGFVPAGQGLSSGAYVKTCTSILNDPTKYIDTVSSTIITVKQGDVPFVYPMAVVATQDRTLPSGAILWKKGVAHTVKWVTDFQDGAFPLPTSFVNGATVGATCTNSYNTDYCGINMVPPYTSAALTGPELSTYNANAHEAQLELRIMSMVPVIGTFFAIIYEIFDIFGGFHDTPLPAPGVRTLIYAVAYNPANNAYGASYLISGSGNAILERADFKLHPNAFSNVPTGIYKIKQTVLKNGPMAGSTIPTISGMSSDIIVIPSLVKVTFPTAKQTLWKGKTYNITWKTDKDVSSVNINLKDASGNVLSSIAPSVPTTAGAGSFKWTVPSTITDGTYIIGIGNTADTNSTVYDSGSFIVKTLPQVRSSTVSSVGGKGDAGVTSQTVSALVANPPIAKVLLSPNNLTDYYQIGTSLPITWRMTNIDGEPNKLIYLTSLTTNKKTLIAKNVEPKYTADPNYPNMLVRTLSIPIPTNFPTGKYTISIYEDTTLLDGSDNAFTIGTDPTNPNDVKASTSKAISKSDTNTSLDAPYSTIVVRHYTLNDVIKKNGKLFTSDILSYDNTSRHGYWDSSVFSQITTHHDSISGDCEHVLDWPTKPGLWSYTALGSGDTCQYFPGRPHSGDTGMTSVPSYSSGAQRKGGDKTSWVNLDDTSVTITEDIKEDSRADLVVDGDAAQNYSANFNVSGSAILPASAQGPNDILVNGWMTKDLPCSLFDPKPGQSMSYGSSDPTTCVMTLAVSGNSITDVTPSYRAKYYGYGLGYVSLSPIDPPSVDSSSPNSAAQNAQVTLTGSGFSIGPSTVAFVGEKGPDSLTTVGQSTDGKTLRFTVPATLSVGAYQLNVNHSNSVPFNITTKPAINISCTLPNGSNGYAALGKPFTLTATAGGGNGTYAFAWNGLDSASWYNPKPTSATTNQATTTYMTGGNKIVNVNVTSGSDKVSYTCPTIMAASINDTGPIPQPLSITCTSSTTQESVNKPVTYTATATGGNGTYTYSWGSGITGATRTVSYTSLGMKSMSVNVASGGQNFTQACGTVRIIDVPLAGVPHISSISKTEGHGGDIITITGTNFSPTINNINFIGPGYYGGGTDAVSTDGTSLSFTIPQFTAGTYTMSIRTIAGGSNTLTFTLDAPLDKTPHISGISSGCVEMTDCRITISGYNFTGSNIVKIDGTSITNGSYQSGTAINIDLPKTLTATTYPVTVTNENGTSTAVNLTIGQKQEVVPMIITSVSPTSGPVGTVITITGTGFETTDDTTVYMQVGDNSTYTFNVRSTDGTTLTFPLTFPSFWYVYPRADKILVERNSDLSDSDWIPFELTGTTSKASSPNLMMASVWEAFKGLLGW